VRLEPGWPTKRCSPSRPRMRSPETAYIVREGGEYRSAGHTDAEKCRCGGHATLASAGSSSTDSSQSERASCFVRRAATCRSIASGERLVLDFPRSTRWSPRQRRVSAALVAALGKPAELYSGFQWLALYDPRAGASASARHGQHPCNRHSRGHRHGPGKDCDFVSRFFAPAAGRPEDPVTARRTRASCHIGPKSWEKPVFRASSLGARGRACGRAAGRGPATARLPGSGPTNNETARPQPNERSRAASPARPRFFSRVLSTSSSCVI